MWVVAFAPFGVQALDVVVVGHELSLAESDSDVGDFAADVFSCSVEFRAGRVMEPFYLHDFLFSSYEFRSILTRKCDGFIQECRAGVRQHRTHTRDLPSRLTRHS